MFVPDYVRKDPYLMPHAKTISGRLKKAWNKEKELISASGSLPGFAMGHHYFGLFRTDRGWVLREWAPNATHIHICGDFSGWEPLDRFALKPLDNGCWEIVLPPDALKHGELYKLQLSWEGGSGERVPAWARRVVQDPETLIFNAQVWDPPHPYHWKHPLPLNPADTLLIYEAHAGMATEEYKVGSWDEFRLHVLPRIHRAGYNTIQLMAIQEHPYYGSFGYHVSNLFAPSSRFGTPEDLKALIDEAHGLGMQVIMDIVHSHATKNEVEGISRYDGTLHQFFHDGPRGDHPAWDSRCYDYGKHGVLHFLLSNCRYWLEEFCFDGFRFDGVTSMLYLDHGLGSHFSSYEQYFNLNQDEDAMVYLYLANKLIHEFRPAALTVAEEMSGMPGLAATLSLGGFGFDYRLAMGVPDFWIRLLKEKQIEFWNVEEMFYQLSGKREEEQTIHYAESHDQALVGDKTIMFRLCDSQIYGNMLKDTRNLVVDNAMALHKMIRLATISTAGNGYLNFMGNEFGHPEWIDFPGAHNNWSYHYARRQWSLADHPGLKYAWLAEFDREMITLFSASRLPGHLRPKPVHIHVSDQVLVFVRAGLVFVFNFNPHHSYTDYRLSLPPGKFRVELNTDNPAYGGEGRLDEHRTYCTGDIQGAACEGNILLYLPALSAYVLRKTN